MNCLSQVIGYFSYTLEHLGLYEPEITVHEAKDRLNNEGNTWLKYQTDRQDLWNTFQGNNMTTGPLQPLVAKTIIHLEEQSVKKGVAVDLGCGINTTTFHLLQKGWKVYAVDNSESVISTLAEKVSPMGKNWINNGQLVLVNESIEKFKYPEKVDLIIATDSLPYCDPNKIGQIFLEARNALLPQGVLVCNFFPYSDNPYADNMLRGMFGAWMTTKNVVDAMMRSVDFPSWSVIEGKSPGGMAKQFHVFAKIDS
ncbi:MAG: class I SAM-dependent methyltransferase [Chlamydiota bacterium]|nr:class I SAM-dependent methyltransferase [Chlamydiota bacterium]